MLRFTGNKEKIISFCNSYKLKVKRCYKEKLYFCEQLLANSPGLLDSRTINKGMGELRSVRNFEILSTCREWQ